MMQTKIERVTMSLRRILPVLAAVVVILATGAGAQQSLGDLVREAGLDWMAGRWVATTDQGQKIEAVYRWELNRHLVSTSFKMGEFEGRGMIYYSPTEDRVVQVGVDNQGGSNKGIWYPEGDKAIAKLEYTQASGESGKMAVVHWKVDARTMKAAMYAVQESGELADEPWATLEYKRVKAEASKKVTEKVRDISVKRKAKKRGAPVQDVP